MSHMSRATKLALLGVVLVLIATAAVTSIWYATPSPTRVRAHFDSAVGLHPGDEVRILGVKVGTITAVTPGPADVSVDFDVDGSRKVPADVKVAVLAPSLVTGRYIQLAPAYSGGPRLADGANIPIDRTAVPVEWDQIKDELNTLSQALGPNPKDPQGALARLLNSSAKLLKGNGATLHDTLVAMHTAATTLGDNSQNLFASIRNLNKFIAAMNASSAQIQQFTSQLHAIAAVLNDNRQRMAQAIALFDSALQAITKFVAANKSRIQSSLAQVADVAVLLQNNQTALANVLHVLPTALANFYNLYDPDARAFGGRAVLPYGADVPTFICQAIYSAGGTLDQCRGAIGTYLEKFNRPDLRLSADLLPGQGTRNWVTPGPAPDSSGTSTGPADVPPNPLQSAEMPPTAAGAAPTAVSPPPQDGSAPSTGSAGEPTTMPGTPPLATGSLSALITPAEGQR